MAKSDLACVHVRVLDQCQIGCDPMGNKIRYLYSSSSFSLAEMIKAGLGIRFEVAFLVTRLGRRSPIALKE